MRWLNVSHCYFTPTRFSKAIGVPAWNVAPSLVSGARNTSPIPPLPSGTTVDQDRISECGLRCGYFNLSASFVRAKFAHAASLSPPGAPLTATAPMVTSPNLIGTPPCALMVPGMVAGGAD